MEALSVGVQLCLGISAALLVAGLWLLAVHAPMRPPARLAHLTRAERKKRIKNAGWVCVLGSVAGLVAAALMSNVFSWSDW